MKRIYLIIIPIISLACSSINEKLVKFENEFTQALNKYSDTSHYKIKIEEEYWEHYYFGFIPYEKVLINKTMSVIDSNNQPIEYFHFYNKSYLKKNHRDVYSKAILLNHYDDSSKLLKQIQNIYQTGDAVIPQVTFIDSFKYDSRNNQIEWIRFYEDHTIRFVEKSEYNDKNYLLKKYYVTPNEDSSEIILSKCYNYRDSSDYLIREDCERPYFSKKVSYLKNNKIIKEIIYDVDGVEPSSIVKYEHKNNKLIETIYSKVDLLLFSIEIKVSKNIYVTNSYILKAAI